MYSTAACAAGSTVPAFSQRSEIPGMWQQPPECRQAGTLQGGFQGKAAAAAAP